MSKYNFYEILRKCGAIWEERDWQSCLHSRSNLPHALLTSGKHSNGFVNMSVLLSHPYELDRACRYLMRRVLMRHGTFGFKYAEPDWVVGCATGGITIAHECGKILDARSAFMEKSEEVLQLARFTVPKKTRVLPTDDVLTTGGTAVKMLTTLDELGIDIIPVIATLANRNQGNVLKTKTGSFEICSLIELHFTEWEPSECPFCKAGSPALRPKKHWDKFVPSIFGAQSFA